MSPLQRKRRRSPRIPRGLLRAVHVDPRLLLALFSANDLNALIETTFKLLRASVTCDFAAAFYRSSGTGLLKQRDSRGRVSDPAFMRRYMELTPALAVAMANPGIKIICTRTVLPK